MSDDPYAPADAMAHTMKTFGAGIMILLERGDLDGVKETAEDLIQLGEKWQKTRAQLGPK